MPLKFITAGVEKSLPLTVRTKSGPPELVGSGAGSEMAGMAAATAGVLAFEP
ncbi:MAG: hypothetical protein ABSF59_14445 [Candidatus Sulfotelmatobacter sp.]